MPLHKGDEVKVIRGSQKGLKAKIAEVDLKNISAYLEGQLRTKVTGKKVPMKFQPSNLIITNLNLADKKREAMIRKTTPVKQVK